MRAHGKHSSARQRSSPVSYATLIPPYQSARSRWSYPPRGDFRLSQGGCAHLSIGGSIRKVLRWPP